MLQTKILAAAALGLIPAAVLGQTAPPRTPWGAPDLRGVWSHGTATPLERPERYGERDRLTEAEVAEVDAAQRSAEGGRGAPRGVVGAQPVGRPHFDDRRSPRRPHPLFGGGPGAPRGPSRADDGRAGGPQPAGALHLVRHPPPGRPLQPERPHRADPRPRASPARDGPRVPGHSSRRKAARAGARPPVARRLARPLGRRHARRRDHPLP